jgi:hypothetical protein
MKTPAADAEKSIRDGTLRVTTCHRAIAAQPLFCHISLNPAHRRHTLLFPPPFCVSLRLWHRTTEEAQLSKEIETVRVQQKAIVASISELAQLTGGSSGLEASGIDAAGLKLLLKQ